MSTFALDLEKFGSKAEANINTVIRKVALDLLRGVVLLTPVLTGRARANWQTAIGAPATGDLDAPSSPGAAASRAIDAGTGTLTSELARQAGKDVTVFLTNNLPYIERLENGWSKQAPEGMVRQTISRFPYLVDTAAQEVASGSAG